MYNTLNAHLISRGEICPSCHCRRECKSFVSGVNFSILLIFSVFLPRKLLKLDEIDGEKFLAWKSDGIKFWTNLMCAYLQSHN